MRTGIAAARGRFVVFEGLDGSGKSTQIDRLMARLTAAGIPAVATREPSDGNILGRTARDAVKGKLTLADETLALLFAADRFEHIQSEVLPLLQDGVTVLCDRYYSSNFAYQAVTTPLSRLMAYNEPVMALLRPDLTVFLDLSPEACMQRIHQRSGQADEPQRELFEGSDMLRAVRSHYMAAFDALRGVEPIATIAADRLSPETLAEKVWFVASPLWA